MTAINPALRAGLDSVYSNFGPNGVVDIGLQSALDVGVSANNYISVPRSCLKTVSNGEGETATTIANGPSGVLIGKCDPVYIAEEWKVKDKEIGMPAQDQLSSSDLGLLAIANLHAAITARWEERYAKLVAAAHVHM